MELKEVNYRCIKADEGYVLTQAATDTPLLKRCFATKIALAAEADADRYTEITVAEAEALKKQQTEERERQRIAEQRERRLAELQREMEALQRNPNTEIN